MIYMEQYLREKPVLNFSAVNIQYLMSDRAWKKELQQLHKRFL